MPLHIDDAADKPATKFEDEIEVTPDMIEAGKEVIWSELRHDPLMSPTGAEYLAERVLREGLLVLRKRIA
jgi:hypothetical protein